MKRKIIIALISTAIVILIAVFIFSQFIFVTKKAVQPKQWHFIETPKGSIDIIYNYESNGFPLSPGYIDYYIFKANEPGEIKIAWFYINGDYITESQSTVSVYKVNDLMGITQIASGISIKDADVTDFDNTIIRSRVDALKRLVADYAAQKNKFCEAEIYFDRKTRTVKCELRVLNDSDYDEFYALIDNYLLTFTTDKSSVMFELPYEISRKERQ
jgi:hypothetical protein